jgi:hypothetical protein
MASLSDATAAFLARFDGVEVPEWSTPSDLTRLGMEAIAVEQVLGRELPSHGAVRLTGPAVIENSARLDSTGDVLVKLQKLVTAIGASLEGAKSQMGPLTDRVRSLTQLRLVANPAPGSVVLQVAPEVPPAVELYPDGQVPLVDESQPLVDRSAGVVLEVLERASGGAGDTAALAERLDDLGARVAAGVRNLAQTVVESGVEVEWSWALPRQSFRSARLSTATARLLGDLVAARHLDVEEVTIVGVLHTISDTTAWDLQTDEGPRIRLRRGNISPEVTATLHVGQRVEVVAEVEVRVLPGGLERAEYTALRVRPLEPEPEPSSQ